MNRSDMVARLAISLMTKLPEQCQKLIKKYVDPNFNVWEPEE